MSTSTEIDRVIKGFYCIWQMFSNLFPSLGTAMINHILKVSKYQCNSMEVYSCIFHKENLMVLSAFQLHCPVNLTHCGLEMPYGLISLV